MKIIVVVYICSRIFKKRESRENMDSAFMCIHTYFSLVSWVVRIKKKSGK